MISPDEPSDDRTLDRACPSCGLQRGRLLFEQRFAKIEGISILGGYDVVVCSGCGVCFADGIPDQSTFERYYREASKYEGTGKNATLPAATLQRFEQEVADIVRFLP